MDSIQFDYSDFTKKISQLKTKIPNIAKKLMASVMKRIRTDIRSNISSKFNERTGRLRRSINYYAFNDWAGTITTKQKDKSKSGYYSMPLEKGAFIQAKEGKYLTFKINGEWKKVKSVSIPARPFMEPVVKDYFGGNGEKARHIMDEELEKQLEKIMEKK